MPQDQFRNQWGRNLGSELWIDLIEAAHEFEHGNTEALQATLRQVLGETRQQFGAVLSPVFAALLEFDEVNHLPAALLREAFSGRI